MGWLDGVSVGFRVPSFPMALLRVRFRLRTLMIAVGVAALLLGLAVNFPSLAALILAWVILTVPLTIAAAMTEALLRGRLGPPPPR